MIIEQYLPALHYGDAVGNSTLRFHDFLRKRGIESRIIALTIDENMRQHATYLRDVRPHPEALKILHYAVPSELTDFFLDAGGKKVMIYHNVTPACFFTDFSDDLVRFTHAGRVHLERLKHCFQLVIADSNYNANELRKLSFERVEVFPIMIDLSEYDQPVNAAFTNLFKDERKNIVFVGRITPNKKIEDLIKIVFFFKKYLSPSIRLIVAGNPRTLPKYFWALKDLAYRFYLTAEDVVFTGHIPFDELMAVYRLGDVYMTMSEHEGFCLPLIESCYFKLPVIAYHACAVPEILDNAGILVREKRFEDIAGLAEKVLKDDHIQVRLKQRAEQRIQKYKADSQPERLFSILGSE